MSASKPYDLLVVGEEPAGLAAAACAARTGARVALLRAAPARPPADDIYSTDVPNFVWRRLDLQGAGLALRSAPSLVSLFEDGRVVKTYESARRTSDALASERLADGGLWEDFVAGLKDDATRGSALAMRLAGGRAVNGAPFAPGLVDIRRVTATCASYLNDYFEDNGLKTHVASAALAPFGLGGGEAGSAAALAALFEDGAWPTRVAKGGLALAVALERACVDARVEFLKGEIRNIDASDAKLRVVDLGSGGVARARFVLCASPRAGRVCGVRALQSLSPLDRRGAAEAHVRLKLAQPLEAPKGEKDAIFYVAGSMTTLAAAREEALEGRIPTAPPLVFELADGGDIHIRAPYCPERLIDEGDAREWSEQDRQALSMRIIKRLTPYLDGLERVVKKAQVNVFAPPDAEDAPRVDPLDAHIVAPPPSGNVIGAAVRLADVLLNRD